MNNNKWEPNIKWYKITPEAYRLIYDEAKERYEDIMSESESITNKSIRMLIALAAFIGFTLDFAIKQNFKEIVPIYFLLAIILVDVWLLYKLIAPKHVKGRGVPPDLSINKVIDYDENKDNQVQLTYYTLIVTLQRNIYYMIDRNNERAKYYKKALMLFLITFIGSSVMIVQLLRTALSG